MANYHLTTKMIKRSSGHSSVAASAYRAHKNIKDERTGIWHKYATRSGIVHSEIFTPDSAPEWTENRSALWNTVEKFETRKNSQTAQEIEVSLPIELSFEENLELARDFVNNHIVNHPSRGGRVADMSIHYEEENPHAHILITTRAIDGNSFNSHKANPHKKGAIQELKELREEWSEVQNTHLREAGHNVTVDHRTLSDQSIDRVPTKHEGKILTAQKRKDIELDKDGEEYGRLDENYHINHKNKVRAALKLYEPETVQKELVLSEERMKDYSPEMKATPTS